MKKRDQQQEEVSETLIVGTDEIVQNELARELC